MESQSTNFQDRVKPWLITCFGEAIANDRQERNHRFLEEALELVQACGCDASEAHQLVDYVFSRPVGEPKQESGGVSVTHASLCLANGIDMQDAADVELNRIWTKVEAIRAKQAAKPKHSPLPMHPQVQAPRVGLVPGPKSLPESSSGNVADDLQRFGAVVGWNSHYKATIDALAERHGANGRPSPEEAWHEKLARLRNDGWAVAVHNDYRLQGKNHTFWLFTRNDRAIKGEGHSDEEALDAAAKAAELLMEKDRG